MNDAAQGPYTCFKAYDVRGQVPSQLNADIVYRIGRACVEFLGARKVVIGHDIRLTSAELSAALARGLNDSGADVLDIGRCGTEEISFATQDQGADGGIVITASHNPKDYNGLKFVRESSKPISGDTGLEDIRRLAEAGEFTDPPAVGTAATLDASKAYIDHLLSWVDTDALEPLKLVVNAGNGGAGPVVDALAAHLPFDFVRELHEPDGNFPNGVPNPLLPENRALTAESVRRHGAAMGIAWDGDFDRCFFFDEEGEFIEGYYLVGLLAGVFLERFPGSRIIHAPRLVWNTQDIVTAAGGETVQCKAGHAFIKEAMRRHDAVYGGEMSAHHYFRDFAYCDSGMIPWLLVAEVVSRSGRTLGELVRERQAAFPASGEINREIADPAAALARAESEYAGAAESVDYTDGLSVAYADWRFNLRKSNTEPVVRLNVESRGDVALMEDRTQELLGLLDSESGSERSGA